MTDTHEDLAQSMALEFTRQTEAFRVDLRTRYICPELGGLNGPLEAFVKDPLDAILDAKYPKAKEMAP
jgi:hypothetical protein